MTGRLALADPLPLADRVRRARRPGVCTICTAPITIGQPIAHLATPRGWCHVRCAPAVVAALGTITRRPRNPRGSTGRHTVKIITITPDGDLSELTNDELLRTDEVLRTNLMLQSKPVGSFGALADGALVYAVPAINSAVTAELGNIWAGKAHVIIHGLQPEHHLGH